MNNQPYRPRAPQIGMTRTVRCYQAGYDRDKTIADGGDGAEYDMLVKRYNDRPIPCAELYGMKYSLAGDQDHSNNAGSFAQAIIAAATGKPMIDTTTRDGFWRQWHMENWSNNDLYWVAVEDGYKG